MESISDTRQLFGFPSKAEVRLVSFPNFATSKRLVFFVLV